MTGADPVGEETIGQDALTRNDVVSQLLQSLTTAFPVLFRLIDFLCRHCAYAERTGLVARDLDAASHVSLEAFFDQMHDM